MTDAPEHPSQKRLGRPRVYREPRRQMNVMLPEALLDQIDAYLGAHPDAQSRNEWIEQALRAYLEKLRDIPHGLKPDGFSQPASEEGV